MKFVVKQNQKRQKTNLLRSYYSYDLIIGYKFVEEGDVCTERLPTCDWMDYIPMDRKEESLFIRISKIKESTCYLNLVIS